MEQYLEVLNSYIRIGAGIPKHVEYPSSSINTFYSTHWARDYHTFPSFC